VFYWFLIVIHTSEKESQKGRFRINFEMLEKHLINVRLLDIYTQ